MVVVVTCYIIGKTHSLVGLCRCVVVRLHGGNGAGVRLRAAVDARRNLHVHRPSSKAHPRRKTGRLCAVTRAVHAVRAVAI